jgi:hypothetical protein
MALQFDFKSSIGEKNESEQYKYNKIGHVLILAEFRSLLCWGDFSSPHVSLPG